MAVAEALNKFASLFSSDKAQENEKNYSRSASSDLAQDNLKYTNLYKFDDETQTFQAQQQPDTNVTASADVRRLRELEVQNLEAQVLQYVEGVLIQNGLDMDPFARQHASNMVQESIKNGKEIDPKEIANSTLEHTASRENAKEQMLAVLRGSVPMMVFMNETEESQDRNTPKISEVSKEDLFSGIKPSHGTGVPARGGPTQNFPGGPL